MVDVWITGVDGDLPWCGYDDDGVVRCGSEREAEVLRAELEARLAECHLELHPTKTKIVYCKDGKRKATYPNVKFDFLGYCFRPRWVRRLRDNTMFCGFNPAVSPCGAENHAVNDPGLGHPPSNADDAGRHRPADQSALTGLDRILRAIRALCAAPCAPTRQPDAAGLGEAEVQALCCS